MGWGGTGLRGSGCAAARLDEAVRLAGFLMTMPEVYKYAAPGVAIKALERFEGITTAQEGQVAIDALVAEARAAFAPASEGEDPDAKKKAKKEAEAKRALLQLSCLR